MLLHFLRTAPPRARARALRVLRTPRARKSPEDVEWLLRAMTEAGSLEHGRRLAVRYSEQAMELDGGDLPILGGDGDDRRFVREMLRYVIDRVK